jgi:mannonate dehydratase
MYVGTQLGGSKLEEVGDRYLRQLAQLGIVHVCIDPPGNPYSWTRDVLKRHIDRVDAAGLVLDMVQLPLPSSGIEKNHQSPGIVLGQGPERDREIDGICRLIEDLSAMGIGAAKYNFNLLGIPRTPSERGRGGAILSTFRQDQLTDSDTLTAAGQVSTEQMWERITYFLERVVPVAEANKLRLACHPHDPLTPPGYRGMEERVLGSAEGLKHFVSIAESPYHGLNFCQGTVAAMLDDPGREIFVNGGANAGHCGGVKVGQLRRRYTKGPCGAPLHIGRRSRLGVVDFAGIGIDGEAGFLSELLPAARHGVLQAVGVAVHLQDMNVVGQPIEQRAS